MTYYIYFLMALHFLMLGVALEKADSFELFTGVLSLLMYFPLFGRVLGWF